MTFHFGRTRRWWDTPLRDALPFRLSITIVMMVVAALYCIFSDPVARWWFGGLVLGSLLMAVVIRLQRGDGF